jgi:hypothetical protein
MNECKHRVRQSTSNQHQATSKSATNQPVAKASNQQKMSRKPALQEDAQPLQTEKLLKQAEFVQKMLKMKLMPEINGQRITYRPMSVEEQKNPMIELPLGFRPPNAVVKKVSG